MNTLKTLVITPGEPAGIGLEILIKLIQKPLASLFAAPVALIVVANKKLLKTRAKELQLPLFIQDYHPGKPVPIHQPQHLVVLDIPLDKPVILSQLSINSVPYVLQTLDQAIKLVNANSSYALVTGPIHKGIINQAGIPFTGHTEYLAAAINLQHETVMMLAVDDFRVALVTTHCPLREVAALITSKRLTHIIKTVHHSLSRKFNIKNPKLLIAGLNPHAGEMGHLGSEEIDIIIPTIQKLNTEFNIAGPFPADTLFTPERIKQSDAIIAMYHDQGLSVLKHKGFGKAVNITLGLPFIRTSVDHGVALDKATTYTASPQSLFEAMHIACKMLHTSAANITSETNKVALTT